MAFWEGSADVLAIPFLLQWTLMQVAVAAAFLGLSRLRQERSNRALTGTVAAAVVATFSSGNALVLWPLVLGVALLLRLKKKQMAVLLASAAVNLSLYFVGYRFSSSIKLRNFTDYPVYAFQYIASYLSLPFGGIGGPAFGVRTGMLSVAVTVSVLLVAWRRGLLASPPSVVLFSYYGFTLLTAVMTAGGRMDPDDSMFQAAK